ncbi:DUF2017 domain-containing protein [Mycolicibacterium sp.]|uniref:oxidative stress transcriptional regulator AosR n=1 Tax=Mycolicibacterium sp. TaxID=2320850 RepID=UPI001D97174A|nr:DUF2017 domain-containing protein [Mycolicibacterium sp.]MCB1291475.1 DUF2017 domain-containing protein [Mycobacterium sp.]MCB9409150.1 DUF2017 domain-containing protein [Mycolicibacterium sp.]
MRKWKRVDTAQGPRFVSALERHEVELLRNMATSVQQMLDERQSSAPSDPLEQITGIRAGNSAPPENTTMRRLLPDFVKDGAEAAADTSNSALRSLHEPQIIDGKIAAAQRLLDTLPDGGGRLELTEEEAEAWTAAVNDIRLTLGTLLQIGPDGPDRLPSGHPMAAHLEVYQWLTVLQEYLVLGLMGKPIR